jgi:hypothetical protein
LALPPQNQDAFLREVDEELRRDQMGQLWRRYGPLAIAVLVIGLAALGGWLWWQADQHKKAGQDGELLTQAITDLGQGKEAGVQAKLDTLSASPREAYRAAAKLTKAAVAGEKGDAKAAIVQYKLVADDPANPQPFRDLARVRQTVLEFDTLPPAEVIARMKPLAVAGNPWFGSAGELVAISYIKLNKPELAGPLFAAIAKDEQVPETIRGRAARIAGVLGVDAVAQPATTKEITE